MVQLMPLQPETPSSLTSFKSRLVLHLCYRVSQFFLEKRPLNGVVVVVVIKTKYCKQDHIAKANTMVLNLDTKTTTW